MTKALADTAAVPGWGVDADRENDPTYPMRHQEDQQARGLAWTRPPQQAPQVEILRSIEHHRLPAVVGTSTPPSGLSGVLRRWAFRRSESDWFHWLMLMGADRINVVEGVVNDLARGKVPNVPAEMGARAEWQHNKAGLIRKIGAVAVIGGLAFAFTRAWRDAGAGEEEEGEAEPTTSTPIVSSIALPDGAA